MKMLVIEDSSFFMMKIFEDKPIASAVNIISETSSESDNEYNENTDPQRIKNSSLSEKHPCQQIFIFNNSFELDQVILALKNEICTAIGQNVQEEKIVDVLKRLDKSLKNNLKNNKYKKDKFKVAVDFKILINELISVIKKSKIAVKNNEDINVNIKDGRSWQ